MAQLSQGGPRGAEPPLRRRPRHPGDRGADGSPGRDGADAAVAGAGAPAGAHEVTRDHSSPDGDPHGAETERLLAGLRFVPRASLGPEIAGRVRRGEVARVASGRGGLPRAVAGGGRPAGCPPSGRGRLSKARVTGGARGSVLPQSRWRHRGRRRIRGAGARTAHRASDALRGPGWRPAVLRCRPGPAVARPSPGIVDDSVAGSIRVCCVDLDGEGPADDGLLVLNAAGERVVLAGIFEQDARAPTPVLRLNLRLHPHRPSHRTPCTCFVA
ncbi:MAG: hypothetical protein MZV64_32255 [Ignavibacteriales bacterium]|nr:hypothetical protein [Ignavibacteriales bacterium]